MTAGAVLLESARLLVRRPWPLVVAAAVVVPLDVFNRITSNWFLTVPSIVAGPVAQGAVAALALAILAGREADTVAALRVALRRVTESRSVRIRCY
jgi:hypothetical protein